MKLLARVAALILSISMLLAGYPDGIAATSLAVSEVVVVEHLRIKVPADGRQPGCRRSRAVGTLAATQDGFLGRELLWDSEREEGTLLIRWASREQWKAIPEADVEAVQTRFEELARAATGQRQGNPFPLVFECELIPAA